jgi:hypothetical protein
MVARNAPGKPDDLHSVAEVLRFDPKTSAWTALKPLPKPRSSHDAVVVGDTLYVAGGWRLSGSTKGDWDVGALSLDLADSHADWQVLPDPGFRRRALSIGTAGGKVYVIGGINADRDVVPTVSVYDPQTKRWSEGPDLPGKDKDAFGVQVTSAGGFLYANGMDGAIHRLSSSGTAWETVGNARTRSFLHRLAPLGDDRLILIGGASPTTREHLRRVEIVQLTQKPIVRASDAKRGG